MKRNRFAILFASALAVIVAFALTGCGGTEDAEQAAPAEEMTETQPETTPDPAIADQGIPQVTGDTVTTESGLKYIDVTVGEGSSPEAGNVIAAHYTGWLLDGTKFDSSRDRGQPLEFPVGQGRVIKGWDEGLLSMNVGGRRVLIIPSDLAYGERGTPGGPIPPNATLVFDVELVGVNTTATP